VRAIVMQTTLGRLATNYRPWSYVRDATACFAIEAYYLYYRSIVY